MLITEGYGKFSTNIKLGNSLLFWDCQTKLLFTDLPLVEDFKRKLSGD